MGVEGEDGEAKDEISAVVFVVETDIASKGRSCQPLLWTGIAVSDELMKTNDDHFGPQKKM